MRFLDLAFTNSGVYSVQTDRKLLENEKNRGVVLDVQLNVLKKRIWSLQTIPKIKLFLWRVLSGAIAVAERIQSRGIPLDSVCKLCGGAVKTIFHMLFVCLIAKCILDFANVLSPPNGFSETSVAA